MNRHELVKRIQERRNFLCVGLDTDIRKLPKAILQEANPVLAFNKAIIDATRDYCVSYKINTAFYESMGWQGWKTMEETLAYIGREHLVIADAKRGDIGNTADMYARTFFEQLSFDALTLAPYMGCDTLEPYFKYPNKWGIVLALTSNPGSADFEQLSCGDGFLYETVIRKVSAMAGPEQCMFVVGATKPREMESIRQLIPQHFLLVPGVGAQGGSLQEVFQYGANAEIGLLINASRSILYASSGEDFAIKAREEAKKLAEEMAALMA